MKLSRFVLQANGSPSRWIGLICRHVIPEVLSRILARLSVMDTGVKQ